MFVILLYQDGVDVEWYTEFYTRDTAERVVWSVSCNQTKSQFTYVNILSISE